ncbi:type 1 glutamine amidotransferase [Aureimonas flava]|uniref:Type 1 glutamine amidotransferase n=1 Tax=Aureimonas flava TaxID=2320271 RepID=A0A3A1WLU9_9HYPH|nr:type 1 glutamine amidotransferase [Aureimonas flava]RIY02527.1 type 1 glutamine amidotransferase [Aureimonas flava]
MSLRFLIVASETPDQRDARRREVGAASDETYAETLRAIESGLACDTVSCVDGTPPPSLEALRAYGGVVLSGSPIQMHADGPETRSAAAFMARVFEAGTPSFGSCAGLQIATVAAGGRCKPRSPRMEAAFVRGIVATEAGRDHPLLAGRPLAWDAPAMHSDEVATLPDGATILAGTRTTPVQAVEIARGPGTFWGVQYHPELSLAEIAAALRRQADDLLEQRLVADRAALDAHAARIDALDREPERRDLAWQLGLDREITEPARRMREVRNFIARAAARKAS